MTEKEAKKLAAVLETADGGCPHCIGNICEEANEAGFGWDFTHDYDNNEIIVTKSSELVK